MAADAVHGAAATPRGQPVGPSPGGMGLSGAPASIRLVAPACSCSLFGHGSFVSSPKFAERGQTGTSRVVAGNSFLCLGAGSVLGFERDLRVCEFCPSGAGVHIGSDRHGGSA